MTKSFRKATLVTYLLLAVYLMGQTIPDNVTAQARNLDQSMAKLQVSSGAPALASALELDSAGVLTALHGQKTKPSMLAMASFTARKTRIPMDKVMAQNDFQSKPLDYISKQGLSLEQVAVYLHKIQKSVESYDASRPITQVSSVKGRQ